MATPGSPLLDKYNQDGIMTPELSRAVDIAKQRIGGTPLAAPPAPPPAPGIALAPPPAGASPGLVPRPQAQPAAKPAPGITPTPNQAELSRLQSTGSGISQIHHAAARVPLQILDAIGSAFAPGLTMGIPGTQLHHQLLTSQAARNVKNDTTQDTAEAENKLREAQTGEATARTQNLENPQEAPHTLQTAQGIMQWNPTSRRFDIPAGQAPAKEETEGKTVTTDQGIMQWDPASRAYTIKVGNAPEKEVADKTLQDADGNWYHIGKDNKAVPITVNGQPMKGKTTETKASPEQQFLDEYKQQHPNSTIADAETAFKKIRPPEKPQHSMMMIPDGKGGFTAQEISPGSTVAPGSMTPGGMSTQNETPAAVRARQAQGEAIKTAGDQLIAAIEKHRDKIGNVASYWNQFKNGSPIADKDTAGLMAQIASFAALQPALHGFRGQSALSEFEKIIGGVPKNPDALEAAIKAIQGTAQIVSHPGGQGGQDTALPGGITVQDIDAEIARRKGSK